VGESVAGEPSIIDLVLKRLPVKGSTPRGLYEYDQVCDAALLISASPGRSLSVMM
jgi:hypothetical protein